MGLLPNPEWFLRLWRTGYPNFHWAVTWIISFRCNQRCVYCFNTEESLKLAPDYEKGLRELLRVKPKHICISGGEPTLVPGIAGYMRRLREGLGDGLQIEFNTNGTGPMETLLGVLPYIDIIPYSIDGVGEINKAQRGVDGDALLDYLERLVTTPRRPDWRLRRIMIVPTASKKSYTHLPELFRRLTEIQRKSPYQMNTEVKPLIPYDSPLSPVNDPAMWKDYLALMESCIKDYPEIHITIRGMSPFSGLSGKGAKCRSRCWRQFFIGLVLPDGRWTHCKPEEFHHASFKKRFSEAGYAGKWVTALQSVYSLYLNPYALTCYHPCEHGEILDNALQADRASVLGQRVKEIGLDVPPVELERVAAFIKAHCDRSFIVDL